MSRRRDYSIPDCPKIGRYDGLGMAAVPLAIADKERELGINHSSSYSYEDNFEEELQENEKDMNNMYELGKKHGYEKGFREGQIDIYRKYMKAKFKDNNLNDFELDADIFLIANDPSYTN